MNQLLKETDNRMVAKYDQEIIEGVRCNLMAKWYKSGEGLTITPYEFKVIMDAIDHLHLDVSYEEWFKAKVQKALDDPSPDIPHAEVMTRIRQKLKNS